MSFRVLALVTALCASGLANPARAIAVQTQAPALISIANFPQPTNWPTITASTVEGARIGPGVTYERWKLATSDGPLELSVATIDLHNPYVALDVGTHGNGIIGPGERLTSLADRLGAELGINADYFDINDTGTPLGVVIADGRVLHQPDNAATFIVDAHNSVSMGPIAWHATIDSTSNAHLDLSSVNEWSPSVDLAELTPEFGFGNAFGATEMVLVSASLAGTYTVARIDRNLAVLDRLDAGQIGIAAHGSKAQALARDFRAGDSVTITTQSDPSLAAIKLAVGGGPLLLRDGQPVVDPAPPAPEETDVRNPVTGAGVSKDGATLWLVVVDGRAPSRSIGLTRPQLSALFAALGASTAMAFDSGGSSEMVVRQLGDQQTGVANVPSDGRERSIADGLFVMNAAPAGPPTQLVLHPTNPIPVVLVQSKLQIEAHAIDQNDQPVVLAPQSVAFSVEPTSAATIDRNGLLWALRAGPVRVRALIPQSAAELDTFIVSNVDDLQIIGADQAVPTSGQVLLSIAATTKDGIPVEVDPSTVSWSLSSGEGRMLANGTFVADRSAARNVVIARVGGASTSAVVLSGDHAQIFQAVPAPGVTAGQWSYASRPNGLAGGVDASSAPDGSSALRLAYDFSSMQATRAAYAQTSVVLPQQPIALSIDVYGDKNREWLRGGYQNADGNNESVTIARNVDWQGWRTLRVAIPKQAAWPIVWTRFYVVEPSKMAREQGSLWFRNFALIYPGP